MKKIVFILFVSATPLITASCGNFLDENTSNKGYVKLMSDINELILGEGYIPTYYAASPSYMEGLTTGRALPAWIHVMDDDIQVNNNSAAVSLWVSNLGPMHAWQMNPFQYGTSGLEYADPTWSRLYKHINAMNAIIVELDEKFPGETDYPKYKGEALFLRAFYYFYLVNLYALPYDASNDGADPGVPVKTSGKVEDKNWQRGTVKEVYNQMISDLTAAIPLLENAVFYYDQEGAPRQSIYRASQSAARHLLSRVYLYCGMYDDCIGQCEQLLKAGYSLRDYTALAAKQSRQTPGSPEIIFSNGEYRINAVCYAGSGSNASGYGCFRASPNLTAIFDKDDDLRFEGFEWAQNSWKAALCGYYPTFKLIQADGILSDAGTFRLAEIYLNMAEAYALKGGSSEETARSTINDLRAKRFKAGSDYLITASVSGGALIEAVREERRRELCFEGHRWFDLRRYAVCPVHRQEKEIHHEYQDSPSRDGVAQGYYILPRFSQSKVQSNWVMPIPSSELLINHGAMTDNVRIDPVKHEGMDGYVN